MKTVGFHKSHNRIHPALLKFQKGGVQFGRSGKKFKEDRLTKIEDFRKSGSH